MQRVCIILLCVSGIVLVSGGGEPPISRPVVEALLRGPQEDYQLFVRLRCLDLLVRHGLVSISLNADEGSQKRGEMATLLKRILSSRQKRAPVLDEEQQRELISVCRRKVLDPDQNPEK